jgi:hypothetical protein
MKSSSLELIPATIYASTSVITGERQKAVAYYNGQGNSQSIRFIGDDFLGIVTIQATLDTNPTQDSAWVDVYVFPGDSTVDPDPDPGATTDYSITLYGKFTWIRAIVSQFTSGEIGPITLSY